MLSKLLGSTAVVIGLLLAGPQKASADVVFACVNSTTGLLYVVSATTSCPPPSSGATWTKISWNTTASAQPVGTNLLFPYVTNTQNTVTIINFSNTSADPFNTATQTGTCTLSVYSKGTTPITFTTPTIAPGTTFEVDLRSFAPIPTVGYMFAACTFSYVHALASISIGTFLDAQNYMGLIVQTPRPNGENLNN